jgi:hypothetical protein
VGSVMKSRTHIVAPARIPFLDAAPATNGSESAVRRTEPLRSRCPVRFRSAARMSGSVPAPQRVLWCVPVMWNRGRVELLADCRERGPRIHVVL